MIVSGVVCIMLCSNIIYTKSNVTMIVSGVVCITKCLNNA